MKLHGDKMEIPDEPRNLKVLGGIAKKILLKRIKMGYGYENHSHYPS